MTLLDALAAYKNGTLTQAVIECLGNGGQLPLPRDVVQASRRREISPEDFVYTAQIFDLMREIAKDYKDEIERRQRQRSIGMHLFNKNQIDNL